jgi:multidrug efflux pump subunit AcrA (membrane-fusion protein)
MKENSKNNTLLLFLLITALLISCNNQKHAEHADTYTCPMHPTVISDKPGVCPVCGMDLVRKAREGEEVTITEDLAKLTKSPNELITSKINTIKPTYKAMTGTIAALGIVTYDSRNVYNIPAKVGGRLEKVLIKYPFQKIGKGQKIAEIYSPELMTAQREFVFLLQNDSNNMDLIESARNKLILLGLSEKQVAELARRREPEVVISLYSPYDGYVVSENQKAPMLTASLQGTGMNAMAAPARSPSSATESGDDLVRVGSYVSAGQTLFKVVNTSRLFVEMNVPVSQAGSIKPEEEITLDMGHGVAEKGKIDLIQPFFESGEDFLRIHAHIIRSHGASIGQLIKAKIPVSSDEGIWLPREAVVDLGLNRVVFVKERGAFKAKNVTTGMLIDGWVEIKNGVASSDELAAKAQYLVDSESFIKSK